ncbi:MAG: hypothetical protein HC846_03125 [Blastocatellia bacterium]|nr:hypothetical protein [Blastocatellia bacterium]
MNNKKAFFLLLIFTVFLSNAFGQSDLKLPESANSLEGFVPKDGKLPINWKVI